MKKHIWKWLIDPAGMWEGGSEKREKRLKGSGVRVQMDRDTQQTNRIQKSSFRCSIWLCACLLQASEYSEQVRLHETGRQSTQEESKSKILPMNYKNRGFCSLIVVPQLLYTATDLLAWKLWCGVLSVTVMKCILIHTVKLLACSTMDPKSFNKFKLFLFSSILNLRQ